MEFCTRARMVVALVACCFGGAAGAAPDLTLGVSEGTSDGLDHSAAIAKYQGLANAIGQGLGSKVNVVFVREFKALEDGVKNGRFDFVAARPSDYPARGLRDHGYRYVATTLPEASCHVVATQDAPYRTLADLKGRHWVLPEQASFAAQLCRAELRDQGVDLGRENVKYVREQGAVTFYLQNRFAEVGALGSNSGAARQWEKDGQRVLHKGRPLPYFPLIAHGRFSPAQVEAVQKSLLAMGTDDAGRAALKAIGVQQFDTGSEQRLRDLLTWLEQ